MAEATLAISTSPRVQPFRTIRVDRESYELERRAELVNDSQPGLLLVDTGTVIPGHEIKIVDRQCASLPENHVGEIAFRGPSVTPGYYDSPAANAASFRDGWLHTGDLGFMLEGRLFISGRLKDLIIIAGRNHYPQDIERLVSQVPGVRQHHVIAFAVPDADEERLVILAECVHPQRTDGLAAGIRRIVMRDLGVTPYQVVLVQPWSLPMTSSGKPQRARARADYLRGRLAAAGAVVI